MTHHCNDLVVDQLLASTPLYSEVLAQAASVEGAELVAGGGDVDPDTGLVR